MTERLTEKHLQRRAFVAARGDGPSYLRLPMIAMAVWCWFFMMFKPDFTAVLTFIPPLSGWVSRTDGFSSFSLRGSIMMPPSWVR